MKKAARAKAAGRSRSTPRTASPTRRPSRSPATRSSSARACRSRASTPRSPRSSAASRRTSSTSTRRRAASPSATRSTKSSSSRWTTRTRPSRPSPTRTTLINDDQVFGLFNVVGTKNNLAIRDLVNEVVRAEPVRGDRFARMGQPGVPVARRHVPRSVSRSRCKRSSTTSARTCPPRPSRSCAPTTTSALRTPRRCGR